VFSFGENSLYANYTRISSQRLCRSARRICWNVAADATAESQARPIKTVRFCRMRALCFQRWLWSATRRIGRDSENYSSVGVELVRRRDTARGQSPKALKSPACSCVSITLPSNRKRGSQHQVNGCCAWRTRLHGPACRTTADRMAGHPKSDQRREDLCAGGLRKRAAAASFI
jgi:hypothetical protein